MFPGLRAAGRCVYSLYSRWGRCSTRHNAVVCLYITDFTFLLQPSSSAWSTPLFTSWCIPTTAWLLWGLTCRSTCGGNDTSHACSWWESPAHRVNTNPLLHFFKNKINLCLSSLSPAAVPDVSLTHRLQPVCRVRLSRRHEPGGVWLLRHPHHPLQ